jgi:NADPH:quinone reductase-like Zn-dependent oxidoreductase
VKAVVYHRYGSPDVLEYEEIDRPTPGDDEVLIRVRAASVNPLDWRLMTGKPFLGRLMMGGLRKPKKRPGVDVAGVVEAVGRSVTQLRPGDEVFGSCSGAFAEYACASESSLVRKPGNVTFEQAASVPVAGYTALQALRDRGHVRAGQTVLINGASGGVGTFAVQIAKAFGADVTGVCSTGNVDMVRSIGADRVIDYTKEDFTRSGRRYDLILDNASNHPLSACRRVLKPAGTHVMIGGPYRGWVPFLARLIAVPLLSRFSSRKLLLLMAKRSKEDLSVIRDLMESGKVTPVIDRVYPLTETADAVRYLEQGHARGKVVIVVDPDENANLP